MSDFDDLNEQDRALAQRLRAQLLASEELDYVTQAKLAAARARAVTEAGATTAPRNAGWWAAGGLTAAAVLAAVLVLRTPHSVPATADTLELLTDDVDPEFYQDLDMYQWLADSGAGSA
jgi:hypothetical protein